MIAGVCIGILTEIDFFNKSKYLKINLLSSLMRDR